MDQEAQIRDFFNAVADDYALRYTDYDPFYHYFFNERLSLSTSGLEFKGKVILDIGTGTGNLYDYLKKREDDIVFYGVDIADAIIENSNIPSQQQFVGRSYELLFPHEKFDYIFLLGVTSYNTPTELRRTIRFVESALTEDGVAIISFTNKYTLDNIIRTFLKFPARLFQNRSTSRVLSQSFNIFRYSLRDTRKMLSDGLKIDRVVYHNQTVFPFNRFFKKGSISLARRIAKISIGRVLSFFSSDYIVFVSKVKA